MARTSSFRFGFDIVMEKGVCPRPVAIRAWDSKKPRNEGYNPPFKYMADALTGLSLVRLNAHLACPVKSEKTDFQWTERAWEALDPHFALWARSENRVNSLKKEVAPFNAKSCTEFEAAFNAAFDSCMREDGIDLKGLDTLVDVINRLENQNKSPLIYNFGLSFTPAFTQRLHYVYSMLFHLRSVVAVDWNAHVDDPSHEAVRVDSITDYIPKADYVVNDALLYWQFARLSHPFVAGRTSDVRVEKLLVEPMKKTFRATSHNACYLIDNLPARFLESLGPADLEEALHLVQMDWLFGSEAGLLFRLREELYGLANGYEKIFWHDVQGTPKAKAFHLSLGFELNESDFGNRKAA